MRIIPSIRIVPGIALLSIVGGTVAAAQSPRPLPPPFQTHSTCVREVTTKLPVFEYKVDPREGRQKVALLLMIAGVLGIIVWWVS